MTTHSPSLPRIPAAFIVGAAMLAALVVGWLLAQGQIPLAVAIVLAAAYVPLVFLNFPVALALWVAMLYVAHLSALSIAPNAIGILLVVGWLARGVVATKSDRLPVLDQHRSLVIAAVLFALWLGLSRFWAENPGLSGAEISYWEGPLLFVIVAMTISSTRHVQIIAIAMIAGAVATVATGFAAGDLAIAGDSATTAAGGRLTATGGDPNTHAAGFVVAIFLAVGLLSVVRRQEARFALLAATAIVTLGFFATQSRGGLIAFSVALLIALIVTPRGRIRILALAAAVGAGLALFLSANPQAMERLTQIGDGGSGREDIWTVAWRIFQDHPVLGVGLDSFPETAPRYVLEPGPLEHVRLIAEQPHVVHNTYLQLLAENGIVGAALFVFVALASLRAGWLAARHFDARGEQAHANLARAVLTGTSGMMVALFFLSLDDRRLWILFALGPVMLSIARSRAPEPLPQGLHPPPQTPPRQLVALPHR